MGIWEDLACRRAAGGAVGNGLDVGDYSFTMVEVIERNSLFLGDSGRLCSVAMITEGCWPETKVGRNDLPHSCACWAGKGLLSDLVF